MTTTTVPAGSTSTNADVTSGDTLDVQGTASVATIEDGGTETVESGGSDSFATIKAGGTTTVSGTTSYATVAGSETIASGGKGTDETIQSGGTQTVASGGSDTAAFVLSGATQIVGGTATGATVSGAQTINSGGTGSTETVQNGGTQTIASGGTDNRATIAAGGTQVVSGTSNFAAVGGTQTVTSSGTSFDTTIQNGATQTVAMGGTDEDATIQVGGNQQVSGFTDFARVSGTQTIASGGSSFAETVQSGGVQTISAGGTDFSTTVSAGGTQNVFGQASSVKVSGTQTVNAGASDNSATISSGGTTTLLSGATASGATVNAGGTLAVAGNAAVTNTTLNGGVLDLQTSSAKVTGTLTFGGGSGTHNSTLQADVAPVAGSGVQGTVSGFAAGDVIDERGIAYAGASLTVSSNNGNVTATIANGSNSASFNFGNISNANFSLVQDASGGSELINNSPPVCFTTGTLIRVARGGSEVDVPVEALVVGDAAVTASGLHRPIRWIGHRVVDCRALRVPSDSWPVRVRAGAFGVGACGGTLPERDLRLSPGHPVLVGTGAAEVLVPIMCLINGTSIARVPVDTVTYWHVELDAHDILLAEGLPAESFLDYGNRSWFADDGALTDPDVVAPGLGARCRPVAVDGPAVEAERRRLDALFATSLASACAWPGMDDGLMGMSPRP